MIISLEQIKAHLNIDADYTEDDEYLKHLEGVAVEVVQRHIDKTFDEILEEQESIPQPLLHCVLLFTGNLYQNRESISHSTVAVEFPNSLSYILSMYRDYSRANT